MVFFEVAYLQHVPCGPPYFRPVAHFFVEICRDLIVNQVLMSEQERDRIMEEHEKNLAELESRCYFRRILLPLT